MKRLLRSLVAASMLSGSAFAAVPPAAEQAPVEHTRKDDRPVLDVVFVIDTTSSMGGLIEGAKQKVWSIASRMAAGKPTPRVRVGLVAYRDQGDAYVSKVFPLSEDLDAVYKNLTLLRAEGGGDAPEAVQQGLADAVDKMQWSDSKRVAKMIFVVGDQPAHPQDQGTLFAAAKRAVNKGIVVNTIRCGQAGDTEGQFREVARLADGRFDSIDQSGGVVAVATPFDADLSRLNGELMDTSLYAGKRDAIARGEARREEAKALAPSAAADRVSFMAKSEGAGSGGVGGLAGGAASVGAVDLTSVPAKAAELADDELPTNMRNLSKEERVKFAEQQKARRAELEKQIAAVSKKRDDFIASQVKEKKDSFDARVFESVKGTAAKAGVAY